MVIIMKPKECQGGELAGTADVLSLFVVHSTPQFETYPKRRFLDSEV
jgi:hypothetical protein